MLIRLGYEFLYNLPAPTPMLAMLCLHPERDGSVRRAGAIHVEPYAPVMLFMDGFGNRGGRFVAPPGRVRIWDDAIVEDSGWPDPVVPDAIQHRIEDLPPEVLPFLLASRYCEVDRLLDVAWDLFKSSPPGWRRVHAVCTWVNQNVRFGYGFSRPSKTAFDVFQERTGVCRDLNHLAMTFCRCLNIPARYVSGYLGDIGVPISPDPMDFSGWFEAYLGGRWYTFDARSNKPRIGRVVLGRGRDAVDVAMTTAFGANTLEKFTVWTDEVFQV